MDEQKVTAIAVMTSGGDSPGMNAAVRAIVRMGLFRGLRVYGIYNGWQGAVDGGSSIEEMTWGSVGGILQRGGTMLGTARCDEFRTREGRRKAAINLFQLDVDGIVIIGGDGSLTGARILSEEWHDLLRDAAAMGMIELHEEETPTLAVVGMPGSIDNDTFGSDMSIGADTALHRIVAAADQLTSTASAHQRTFILEVMGRNCGYLALAGAVASGAHWVVIPEQELEPRWHRNMVESMERGRNAGRKHAIITVAEGARHPDGLPLDSMTIRDILSKRMGVSARVTVLGHVQRGGAPSAYDRVLATRLGAAAVDNLIDKGADEPPRMLGLINNQVEATSLVEMVDKSKAVGERIDEGDYATALNLRGLSFQDQLELLKLMTRDGPAAEQTRGNLLIIPAGHDAPGMNSCVRVITRVALNAGFSVIAAKHGFEGLMGNTIMELGWMDVSGWAAKGGSELGASRILLNTEDVGSVSEVIRQNDVRAIILIGGMDAYQNAQILNEHRALHPALQVPVVVVPASINNNLPGTDFTIGADTALNNIISDVDKIKDTASANKRAFVIEVFGYDSGYLAIMAAIASGAEKLYIPEEGITLEQVARDVVDLSEGFKRGKRLSLLIRNERASDTYTLPTLRRIMDKEGGDFFDVRSVDLGHTQRGGSPSPFDRILAARLGAAAVELITNRQLSDNDCLSVGLRGKNIVAMNISEALAEIDWPHERQKREWFMDLVDLARTL